MSDRTPQAFFVAGSTGYVGQAVVAELRARNLETIAHIRPGSRRLGDLGPKLESLGATVDSTAWDEAALAETLRSHAVTHVFCLIGTTRKQARAERLVGNIYEQVDLGLTALLAGASVSSGLSPRFVYLSSIGANANASSAYLKARGRAEAHVADSGLWYFIARPSFITGSDRDESRPAERIGAIVADRALSVAGLLGAKKLKARYQSVTAPTLAERLVDGALGSSPGTFEGDSLVRLAR